MFQKCIINSIILFLFINNFLCISNSHADLDVNGKIRGEAVYSFDSYDDSVSPLQTTSDLIANEVCASITVQTNDLILVMLSAILTNLSTSSTYVNIALTSGNAISLLTPTHLSFKNSNSYYDSGSNFGLYKAVSDDVLTFKAHIYVNSGTAKVPNCKIFAMIIGKANH